MRDFNQLPNSDCVGILQELPKTATTKAVILRFAPNWHINGWHLSSPTPEEHNQLYTYSVSFVWGRSWNINDRWAVKTQIGIGNIWNVESKRQEWENRNLDGYHVGNEYGTFCPADIGVTYRF